jgi:hypothetical protein
VRDRVTKGAHSFVIFDTRSAFHSGGDVNDIRAECGDGFGDVFRPQPPCKNDRRLASNSLQFVGDASPCERDTRPAEGAGNERVDE